MKLLNKSVQFYLIYAVLILMIAVPVFYVVIQGIIAEEVDEGLIAQKNQTVSKLKKIVDKESFAFLKAFEPDLVVNPLISFQPYDTLYSIVVADSVSHENIPYRVLESNVLINTQPYRIKLRNSLLDSKDLITSIVVIITLLLLLIVSGLIIINKNLSKKIWKPFYSTLQRLHSYRVDKTDPLNFDKTTINEFNELNNVILSLAQRNQRVYQSQKEFAENASHELQTPLAVFQSKLELLMQTNPLSAEQALLVEDLANASQRISRLNKSLLLLTKIENNQFLEKELVSVNQIISRVVDQYQFRAEQKNINIQPDFSTEIKINANKTLIEILISNLLSNAIRHNVGGGNINITCKGQNLIIENTGKKEGLDKTKLFKRFQKQTTDSNSIGLGLEIVNKICSLYNASIAYSFNSPFHTFTVSFNKL